MRTCLKGETIDTYNKDPEKYVKEYFAGKQ
jgi:hypothetical protein